MYIDGRGFGDNPSVTFERGSFVVAQQVKTIGANVNDSPSIIARANYLGELTPGTAKVYDVGEMQRIEVKVSSSLEGMSSVRVINGFMQSDGKNMLVSCGIFGGCGCQGQDGDQLASNPDGFALAGEKSKCLGPQ